VFIIKYSVVLTQTTTTTKKKKTKKTKKKKRRRYLDSRTTLNTKYKRERESVPASASVYIFSVVVNIFMLYRVS